MTEETQDLTITHTHADGTLIEGTERGDGSKAVLQANNWRWSPNLGCWFVPRSRDNWAKTALIEATRAGLEAAGFTVKVEIDNHLRRPVAEREDDRAERAANRAEHFDTKAEDLAAQAESAWAASKALSDYIPLGQPILTDHYSAPSHRRTLARIDRLDQRGLDAHRASQEAATRAATARRTAARHESPVTIGNRIHRLEADIRQRTRAVEGSERRIGNTVERQTPATGDRLIRLQAEIAYLNEELAYWRAVQTEKQAGKPVYSSETIKKGDHVKVLGHWRKVVRASAKSVSVETGYSWTDRVEYHKITGHQTVGDSK